MEEVKPIVAEDEKPAGEVDTEKPATEVVVEEVSPYKAELEKMEAINRQKEGALKEERRLRKEAEAKLKETTESTLDDGPKEKYLTQAQVDAALDKRMAQQKFEAKLENLSNDPDEQKLVKFHYENSIVKTGDVATDLRMAVAIANQHLVERVKNAEAEREGNEFMSAKVSGGNTYMREGTKGTDPNTRAAAQFLKNIGAGDAEKFLRK